MITESSRIPLRPGPAALPVSVTARAHECMLTRMNSPIRGFLTSGRKYERAFYRNQCALMAPMFEHYGIQLWIWKTVSPHRG